MYCFYYMQVKLCLELDMESLICLTLIHFIVFPREENRQGL